MDVARIEVFQPKKKKVHISDKVCCYLEIFKMNQEEAKSYIKNILSPGQPLPPVTYDCLVTLFNQKCFVFLNQYVVDAFLLYQKICDLIWYISPHVENFKLHGASPPKSFESLFLFNGPTSSKHVIGKQSKHILLAHIKSVITLPEKSFAYRKSLQDPKVEIDKVIESRVK